MSWYLASHGHSEVPEREFAMLTKFCHSIGLQTHNSGETLRGFLVQLTHSPESLLRRIHSDRSASKSTRSADFPHIPAGWQLEELGLKRRTLTALKRTGCGALLFQRQIVSVADILDELGVSFRELRDLLIALNRIHQCRRSPLSPARSVRVELFRDLVRACSVPGLLDTSREDLRLGRMLHDLSPRTSRLGIHIVRALGLSYVPLTEDSEPALVALLQEAWRMSKLSLPAELGEILKAVGERSKSFAYTDRNLAVVESYIGLSTRTRPTLDTVGADFNITRERVRQLCKKYFDRLRPTNLYAPVLDNALAYLTSRCPVSAEVVESELQQLGYCEHNTTIDGLLRFAEILGRNHDVVVVSGKYGSLVRHADEARQAAKLTKKIDRLSYRFGAVKLEDILPSLDDNVPERAFLVAELGVTQGLYWLDSERSWFLLKRRNAPTDLLTRRIKRVMAVCESLPIATLRCALRRDRRLRRVPPTDVLYKACGLMSFCSTRTGQVLRRKVINRSNLFRGDEGIIIELLQTHGPICERRTLQSLAGEAGISAPSFWRCLSGSVTIARYGTGLYGLVGAKSGSTSSPSVSERHDVLCDFGWTHDGRPWIAYELSPNAIECGVLSIPAALRSMLGTRYDIVTPMWNTSKSGTLVIGDGSAWGVKPFFAIGQAEERDILTLAFNLRTKVVELMIGGDELVEQYLD